MATYYRKKKKITLGFLFGETLDKRNKHTTTYAGAPIPPSYTIGKVLLLFFFSVSFLILTVRLMYLTLVKGAYYRKLSNNNSIRENQIKGNRGIIYDRENNVLAQNRPLYLQCKASSQCRYISREEALRLEAEGKDIIIESGRQYPYDETTAHIVGYLSEISKSQLDVWNDVIYKKYNISNNEFCQYCYKPGDFVGVYGTEKLFEPELRGTPGKRLVEVDSKGRIVRELKRVDPVDGENIVLAIDVHLQDAGKVSLETAIKKNNAQGGAFVALHPKTGEVLALYSSPSFNPNIFVSQNTDEKSSMFSLLLEKTLTDPKRPLFNRAISGLYPPGSTFKIITAVAGLEEGVLNESTKVTDTGILSIGPFSFSNWYFTQYGKKEGEVDIIKALQRSNDIFFYKVGEWVGIDNLEKWAKEFGAGVKTGIELDGEEKGMVRGDRKWYLGDTYHVAIGQGDVLATPLQVAHWTQIIANNGISCRPSIEKKETGDCHKISLEKKTLSLIQQGLISACSPGGTAYPLFNFSVRKASLSQDGDRDKTSSEEGNNLEKIQVACKTGTSEVGDGKNTHAWLTAYAPADNPEIVVTVLVEKGGEGSHVAAPVVKDILTYWFSR